MPHLLIPSQAADVLFSFSANSIYYLLSMLLLTFSALFGLMHSSNPQSLISQTPPGVHQQGLASYCCDFSCYDCAVSQWARL